MKLTRIGVTILLMFSLILLATACNTEQSTKNLDKVNVVEVTHSLFYAPQYVAIQKEFFKKEGIQVNLRDGLGGDKTMAALLSGDADIVLVGAETGVYVTAGETQNPVVGIAQLTQTDGSFLVARKPTKDFKWSDLKGKKLLGQRKGGMPEMVSEHVQRKNGLTPFKDVTIIQNVDYKNLPAAFASGTGDYVQLFEPFASQLEKEGKGTVVASFGKDSGRLPYTIYLTRSSALNKDPDRYKRYIRALYKAQKWCATHSAEEIAKVVKPLFPQTDDKILTRVLSRYQSQKSWATDPIIDKEEYNRMLDVMAESNELPKRIPYEKVIQMDIAQKAINNQP
ncbi:NitT/TauT family transport system substrate-binding protein [Marininema mesophilum]|uniref:NitT/TauT family transport system substrate-binding protein n=1 Tax=Marininema mesophilum TaxID=1048340 RepID=A0A1H2S0L9_9BACL|nr:ABC transporter substrate-binding protein [Marininema mesophilum]SDW25161.1 NitT/TauT family transport system substrate-binding protein [Marininema mesophilum]